ncbi:MAG: hypothetical protein IK080_08540 [Clostridia bacterium]|nr:hypothetical protein [Clostridia bacterium]
MEAYECSYKILASDTDLYRRLRLSRLFTLLQEAAIAHTELLGAGKERTLDRGLLWVITRQQAEITRLPVYNETIRLTSLPGDMMHAFFPRYYRITDADGNELVNAAALWVLMDRNSRTMVAPETAGVTVHGAAPSWKALWPRAPKLPADGEPQTFRVPYSYLDLNGHMNNTRYFDLAEDLMPPALRAAAVRDIRMEYTGEAREGEDLTLRCSAANGEFLLSGEAEKRLFRLGLRYDAETE